MPDRAERRTEQAHPVDAGAAKVLSGFAQGTSRRGLFAMAGRLLLRIIGVSLVPLLPVDRVFAQAQNCNDPTYCGQWGNFCAACCGQSAQVSSCPACLYPGAAWSACCCFPACPQPVGHCVSYQDCCGLRPGFTPSQAAACKGAFCGKNPVPQQFWCGSAGASSTYQCTIVRVDLFNTCDPCCTPANTANCSNC